MLTGWESNLQTSSQAGAMGDGSLFYTERREGSRWRSQRELPYQVTYSPEAYPFRFEVLREGKLISGAQQFYAIKK
jgi:hypothetical protein